MRLLCAGIARNDFSYVEVVRKKNWSKKMDESEFPRSKSCYHRSDENLLSISNLRRMIMKDRPRLFNLVLVLTLLLSGLGFFPSPVEAVASDLFFF